jgi:hypothetical protein
LDRKEEGEVTLDWSTSKGEKMESKNKDKKNFSDKIKNTK